MHCSCPAVVCFSQRVWESGATAQYAGMEERTTPGREGIAFHPTVRTPTVQYSEDTVSHKYYNGQNSDREYSVPAQLLRSALRWSNTVWIQCVQLLRSALRPPWEEEASRLFSTHRPLFWTHTVLLRTFNLVQSLKIFNLLMTTLNNWELLAVLLSQFNILQNMTMFAKNDWME